MSERDQQRQYADKYRLDNAKGVGLLLADYHALRQRRYCGDYAACDILCDLATAIEAAGLTGRQREAIRLVYGEDLTQTDAGMRMGVRQVSVRRLVHVGLAKIARVYEAWARKGEGYSLETEAE